MTLRSAIWETTSTAVSVFCSININSFLHSVPDAVLVSDREEKKHLKRKTNFFFGVNNLTLNSHRASPFPSEIVRNYFFLCRWKRHAVKSETFSRDQEKKNFRLLVCVLELWNFVAHLCAVFGYFSANGSMPVVLMNFFNENRTVRAGVRENFKFMLNFNEKVLKVLF